MLCLKIHQFVTIISYYDTVTMRSTYFERSQFTVILIVPIQFRGVGTKYSTMKFCWLNIHRSIHLSGLLVVSLESLSSIEFRIKTIFLKFVFFGGFTLVHKFVNVKWLRLALLLLHLTTKRMRWIVWMKCFGNTFI